MPVLSCPLGTECNKGAGGTVWKTDDIAAELIQIALETHVKFAHQAVAAAPAPATLAAEKLVRPKVQVRDGVIDEEAWEYFVHRWVTYKTQANLTVSTKSHLESCLRDDITVILFGRLATGMG